eukprot:g11957.t1
MAPKRDPRPAKLRLDICAIDCQDLLQADLVVDDAIAELQKLGLHVILIGPDQETQRARFLFGGGVLCRRPGVEDGCEVLRVASEFGCSYVLPDDFEESPFLQPSHRRWVRMHEDLCELRFRAEEGAFQVRLPASMKHRVPKVVTQVPDQPQLFKEKTGLGGRQCRSF